MLWSTSPACTELETHVLDWLVPMLGLPEKFLSSGSGGGVIQDTASSASLCALLAARERATQFASNRKGCDGRLVAYCSTQTHSSVEKAMKIAGMGSDNLRQIDADEELRHAPRSAGAPDRARHQGRPDSLLRLRDRGHHFFERDRSGPRNCRICREHNLWLHVDSAMSGTAALCPEFRFLNDGVEFADSYCFNPHKWMFTNFDCSCFYVADRKHLIQTLSMSAGVPAQPGQRIGRGH
jgi:aromatic-L-amino-acid decarboxylase